ncbi:MAG: IS21 family transposase [Actinomycetota bacterium]
MDVKLMHRQGASVRRIARETGLSRVTVRRILAAVAPKPYGPRKPRAKMLDPFLKRLGELAEERPYARATGLHEALRQEGFAGCYESVKVWLRARRCEERARKSACVRFETVAGLEGQFDWKGPVKGLLVDEPESGVLFFRFVLAWSRARWTLAVRDQKLPSLLASLVWAFGKIGAVPHRLVLDNPKTAVLKPRPRLELHPFFAEFCRHYGTEPMPAWPYHPERKGKTERAYQDLAPAGILHGRYRNLAALQGAVEVVDAREMNRVHGTTGERPIVRLEREREHLLPLPAAAFDPRVPESRRVLSDCTVRFEGAAYSVPFTLVGSRVIVKADVFGRELSIYAKADLVARHARAAHGERVIVEEHVAELRRPRFERLRERAARREERKQLVTTRSIVPWPEVEVEQRSIEEYAEAAGGAR